MDRAENLHINDQLSNIYHAAIIEDEPDMLQYLCSSLSTSFAAQKVSVEFETYPSGDQFLRMIEEHYHYDMIFLDIEMPGLNGIEVCRKIRKLYPECLVVFISGKEELVFQTFEVQPFRFIRKNLYASQLPALTAACTDRLRSQSRKIIQFREPYSGDLFSFHVDEIKYIEALGKSCQIETISGTVIVKGKFMVLENLLKGYSFLKPHRSYLVNCSFIYYIGKQFLKLTDQTTIPISRNKAELIKQQFLQYNMQ